MIATTFGASNGWRLKPRASLARQPSRFVEALVLAVANVDRNKECGGLRCRGGEHRRHHRIGTQPRVSQRRRLHRERRDLGCGPHDLERDLNSSGLGARNIFARPHRGDKRQVCRRILFDELFGAKAQALGMPMNPSGVGPLFAGELGHLLDQGRRRRRNRRGCRPAGRCGLGGCDLRQQVAQALARPFFSRRRSPACDV
jgi:hypothetical protein